MLVVQEALDVLCTVVTLGLIPACFTAPLQALSAARVVLLSTRQIKQPSFSSFYTFTRKWKKYFNGSNSSAIYIILYFFGF